MFRVAGEWIGGTAATSVLCVFYYTIFALFAIPYRLFSRSARQEQWFIDHKELRNGIDAFRQEY